jgi:hypothetical protein
MSRGALAAGQRAPPYARGGYVNSRTTPMSAFAALSEKRVKARTEVPLITERVNVLSGFV